MRLGEKILPIYYDLYRSLRDKKYATYILSGGRGTGKSFAIGSFCIPLQMVRNHVGGEDGDVVIIRKVAKTHAKSTYEQIKTGITHFGLDNYFVCLRSPLEIRYYPQGKPRKQTAVEKAKYVSAIHFLGLDDSEKIKSFNSGRPVTTIWVEEATELDSVEEELEGSILQSLFRGTRGMKTSLFLSFNPPLDDEADVLVWMREKAIARDSTYHLHTTWEDVPKEILGESFVRIAEQMKVEHPKKYEHIYLGKSSGRTKRIYQQVYDVRYSDEMYYEMLMSKDVLIGCDWGSSPDPSASVALYFDGRDAYILHEYEKPTEDFDILFRELQGFYGGRHIFGDSAPKPFVLEMALRGLNIEPVVKNESRIFVADEIDWINLEVEHIYVDGSRTPQTLSALTSYVRDTDKQGNILRQEKPRQSNAHLCDAFRYAFNGKIRREY